ncbi:MAG: hypothetical protein MUP16_10015 [Sedimentisphaerales bacterium]|nr:hypothetical protein [Sedimentisphaerales bacterium]
MMIQIEIGPEFQKTLAELGALGSAVSAACGRGLGKAVKFAAGNVVKNYLTGQALKSRTGLLRKSVDGWPVDDTEAIVGVRPNTVTDKYAWLLGEESKTIVPRNAKFLCIPIGENLTGAGVARFSSPRQVPGGFFVNKGGRLLFGYKAGKTSRAKFRPLFVLVKSVFVQGSGALADGVLESQDEMTDILQEEIEKVI